MKLFEFFAWVLSQLKTEPKLPCPAETRLSNPFGSSANLKFSIVAHPFSFPRTGYTLQGKDTLMTFFFLRSCPDAWYVSCFGLSTKQKKERVKGGRLSSNQQLSVGNGSARQRNSNRSHITYMIYYDKGKFKLMTITFLAHVRGNKLSLKPLECSAKLSLHSRGGPPSDHPSVAKE